MNAKRKHTVSLLIVTLAAFWVALHAEDEQTPPTEAAEFAYKLWLKQTAEIAFAEELSEQARQIVRQRTLGNHFLYWARTHSSKRDLKANSNIDSFFDKIDVKRLLSKADISDPLQLVPAYYLNSEGQSEIYSGRLPKISPKITQVLEDKTSYLNLVKEYQSFLAPK